MPSRWAAWRLWSRRNKWACFNPGLQPLSERSERSGWYLGAHPLHSPRPLGVSSFSGCPPVGMTVRCFAAGVYEKRARHVIAKELAPKGRATAVISILMPEERCMFQEAKCQRIY